MSCKVHPINFQNHNDNKFEINDNKDEKCKKKVKIGCIIFIITIIVLVSII